MEDVELSDLGEVAGEDVESEIHLCEGWDLGSRSGYLLEQTMH